MLNTIGDGVRPPLIKGTPLAGPVLHETPTGISSQTADLLESLKAAVDEAVTNQEDRECVCAFADTVVESYRDCPKRLDGSAAIDHPLSSTLFMIRALGITNPTSIQVSVGHDAIEDGALSKVQIAALAGAVVADNIELLSKRDFTGEAAILRAQGHHDTQPDIRKALYRDWVKGFMNNSILFPVKVSDLADNIFSLWKLDEAQVRPRLHKYVGSLQDIIEELRNPESVGASEIPHKARARLATQLENMLHISQKFLAREIPFGEWRQQAAHFAALAQHDRTDD